MGKHAQRTAAQVLAASTFEASAPSRRKRAQAALGSDDAALGLDEIARAFDLWSRRQDEEEARAAKLFAPPDFASTINSHAATSAHLEPQVETVVVAIVGDARVEELVGRGSTARGLRFRRSRTENLRRARDTIVTLLPDLVVIDVDVPRAKDLVVRLLGDPRTERIPLLVMGTFALQEEMDDYVALGAVRAFDKPVPVSVFRAACVDALEMDRSGEDDDEDDDDRDLRADRDSRLPLIVALPASTSSEPSASQPSPSLTPPSVNAYALAHVPAPSSGAMVRSSLQPLTGRRVLVADADPATVSLIGDAFRTAGCIVEETSLGEHALRAALGRTVTPDLVIVEAPDDGGPVNGVALCAAMRNDVAARDVPVLLLCDADEPDDEIARSSANAVLSKAVSLKTLIGKAGELGDQASHPRGAPAHAAADLRQAARSVGAHAARLHLRDPRPRDRATRGRDLRPHHLPRERQGQRRHPRDVRGAGRGGRVGAARDGDGAGDASRDVHGDALRSSGGSGASRSLRRHPRGDARRGQGDEATRDRAARPAGADRRCSGGGGAGEPRLPRRSAREGGRRRPPRWWTRR